MAMTLILIRRNDLHYLQLFHSAPEALWVLSLPIVGGAGTVTMVTIRRGRVDSRYYQCSPLTQGLLSDLSDPIKKERNR